MVRSGRPPFASWTKVMKKLSKSELTLIKNYCGRITDEELAQLASLLPQSVAGDRSAACALFQRDKEMDKWLSHVASAEDWFERVDAVGEFAFMEIEARSKKAAK